MSIKLIVGSSGSGKTHYCLDILNKNINTNKQLFFIVPEQFSLEGERMVLQKTGKGFSNLYVLGFTRLAYKILESTGISNTIIFGETGKPMLLKKILLDLKNDLVYYKESINKVGFMSDLIHFFTEFSQLNNASEIDKALTACSDKVLKDKMGDLLKIYDKYCEYIQQGFISNEDALTLSLEKIEQYKELSNSIIVIDGFHGFSSHEYDVIKKLAEISSEIFITVTFDTFYNGKKINNPFLQGLEIIENIETFAASKQITCNQIKLENNMRHKNNLDLKLLEKNYFKQRIYPKENCQNIFLYKCETILEEIDYVAKEILMLLKEKKYAFHDIAIITKDLDTYSAIIKSNFESNGLYAFIDKNRNINESPLVELTLSLMDMIITNLSHESVFRFLKTGLIDILEEDIDYLENYVIANNIKGKRWLDPHWSYGFKNNYEDFNENEINNLKNLFVDLTNPFLGNFNKKGKYKIQDITNALLETLLNLDIEKRINESINKYRKQGNHYVAEELTAVWKDYFLLFEKLLEIMRDSEVTISEYKEILITGFASITLAIAPPVLEQIIVGDLERTRLHNIKALFILGVNEGIIPSNVKQKELISEKEKTLLTDLGWNFKKQNKLHYIIEQFNIYTALTKPEEFLFISYVTSSMENNIEAPSPVIEKIKKMYPDLKEKSIKEISLPNENYVTPKTFKKELLNNLSYEQAKNIISEINEKEFFENVFENAKTEKNNVIMLNKTNHNKKIFSSVSQIESYAKCPFSYYIQYNLKAKDRRVYKMYTPEIGTMFHDVLCQFANYAKEHNGWKDFSKDDIKAVLPAFIENAMIGSNSSQLKNYAKYKYYFKTIEKTALKAIEALQFHINNGEFEPLGFEIGFGKDEQMPPIVLELPDNTQLIFTGVIDRVDVLHVQDEAYIKIIDYKTGKKDFNLTEVYYGLTVQLFFYMDAIINSKIAGKDKKLLPGGLFYFKVSNPSIAFNNTKNLDLELLKTLKLSGLVINNPKIVNGIDNDLDGNSNIIRGLRLSKKDGNLYGSVIDDMDFKSLVNHVKKTSVHIAENLKKGIISTTPYKLKDRTGCDFCSYYGICGFDRQKGKYKVLKPLDKYEILKNVSPSYTVQKY